MTTRRLGAICAVVMLAWWAMAPDSVRAEVPPMVIDGIPQPIPVDARLVGTMFSEWRPFMQAATAGDCGPLEHAIIDPHWRGTSFPVLARAQLLDHGLCLEFDPVAAYNEIVSFEPYYPGLVALWRGWKSHYGHGLAKAEPDAVKRDFLRYLLSITWRAFDREEPSHEQTALNVDTQIGFDLGARPVPPMLAEGAAWLKEQLSDRQRRLDLARAMLWGGGIYADGTPLPEALTGRDADMFISALSFLHAEAALMKAEALMQGLLPHYKPEHGELGPVLRRAADCLNHKAILYMISFHRTGVLPGGYTIPPFDVFVLRYTMLARALGIPEQDIAAALGGEVVESVDYMESTIQEMLNGNACRLS